MQSRNQSCIDVAAYADIVKESLQELDGETQEQEIVVGWAVWQVAPKGATRAFSSSAGRRVLSARLSQRLPQPEFK